MTCPVCNGTGFMVVTVSSPADAVADHARRPCVVGCQAPAMRRGGVANNTPLKGREVNFIDQIRRCRISRVRLKGAKRPDDDYDGPASETIDKRTLFGIED